MCVLLALIVSNVGAQQPPAALSLRVEGAEVTDFPQIAVTVTVRDANGVPVPDLDAAAFEINEDRAPEARPIVEVEPVVNRDLPTGLVLVMDVSGSMAGQPLADAKTAALALVEQLGPQDEVAFLAFADVVDLDEINPAREHPPTTDRAVLTALINGLEAAGGTPLYDALYKSVRWAEEAELGHRAVILLTDGVDEGPGSLVASAETPIQEATRNNVPVFTIALGNEIDRGYLERVARTTGGFYQETPDSAELPQLFLNVLDYLQQQYVITYESGLPGDGETHRVQVAVNVGDRTASDEGEFGPLPVIEGETPDPTEQPSDPTEETPVEPTEEPTESPTPEPTEKPVGVGSLGLGNVLAGLGAVAVLALIVVGVVRRRKQATEQQYCLSCGRALAKGEVCPDCGPDAGRFKKPKM
jgi:VWFA-related protein